MTRLRLGVALALASAAAGACEPYGGPRASRLARARDATERPASIPEEYDGYVTVLRARLGARGLADATILVEPPFVVVGDGGATEVARGAVTVRRAVRHLEADFFAKRPSEILAVFLFHDAASYRRGVERLTGARPTTPFGFYSRPDGGLFLDIATGGGTLVHELVHPYVEADFPGAPPWLNEGLGSLFEQSAERDGHIVGLTNWRLSGLQEAIGRGRVPGFRVLTAMGEDEFYREDSDVNYATSRYLLYYLQERGTLRGFYRSFRASSAADPTGYAALMTALGERDEEEAMRRWQRFVVGLSFP